MASAAPAQLTTLIISPSDLKRARRELESLEDSLHQAGLRSTVSGKDSDSGKTVKLPQVSRLVEETARDTGANLLRAADRTALMNYLSDLIQHAPVLHFSFASEPSGTFMLKLVGWLRANIHPQVLVRIGLQPSIAAGCVVRSASRQYDFSLAQAFEAQREYLIRQLTADPKAATETETKQIEAATLQAALSQAAEAEAAQGVKS